MTFGARAVIRPDALRHNLSVIRQAAPDARIMAVVKANAYGHGLETAADALDAADSYAVARLTEARRLREHGISKPVVLLEGCWDPADQSEAIERGCELVIHCHEQLAMFEAHRGSPATVWIKVDSGMHRLGFQPADLDDVLARLSRVSAVRQRRVMTHFSNADDLDSPSTRQQFDAFSAAVAGFDGEISLANSPASLGWDFVAQTPAALERCGTQWIRPGIALYGISPFAGRSGADLGLRPAMQFEGRLIAKKGVRAGETVGYKDRFRVEHDTTIGVIAAGYGDGYSRHFRDGAPVWLNGRRVSLAGLVSMDLMTVDLGAGARDRVGDVAVLWGDELPVEEAATWADTIPYTLVCGITHREVAATV